MAEPLAYLLTWTCYGTWLPGDDRGWVDKHDAGPAEPYKFADPVRRAAAAARMEEAAVTLSPEWREVVERSIRQVCQFYGWVVHQVNARSNHVHVVVTAPGTRPEKVMQAFKTNASRVLNGLYRRKHWWTEGGSKRYLNDERSVAGAIVYVRDQ